MAHRAPFDIKKPLVAAREFTFAGESYAKGDPFPRDARADSFNIRLIKRQYEARAVDHTAEEETAADLIQMTGPKGGRYTITAPWLDEPEVVRGKANAEARLAELKEAGPPEGFGEDADQTGEGEGSDETASEGEDAGEGEEAAESAGEADQGGEGAAEGEPAAEGAEGADAAAGGDTEGNQDPADPHKGEAEQVPGTAPAKAADEVEAAAGKATMVGAGEPAAD